MPLTFLQQWGKMLLGNAVKFTQVRLGLVPEVLNAIDVVFAGGKQLGAIDSQYSQFEFGEKGLAKAAKKTK